MDESRNNITLIMIQRGSVVTQWERLHELRHLPSALWDIGSVNGSHRTHVPVFCPSVSSSRHTVSMFSKGQTSIMAALK